MSILFYKFWKKNDFDILDKKEVHEEANKYKDIENSKLEDGMIYYIEFNVLDEENYEEDQESDQENNKKEEENEKVDSVNPYVKQEGI